MAWRELTTPTGADVAQPRTIVRVGSAAQLNRLTVQRVNRRG